MRKSAFASILLIVFPLIVTGCGTNVEQATPKTQQNENPVGSSSDQLEQVAAPIVTSLKMTNGGDFWTNTWQKEVIPGIYSKFESVNLMFSSDNGELMGYNLFNTPAKSLEVKVTQDQAVNTAKTIAEAKGFSRFIDAKLEVEQPNSYLEGSIKRADYVTLVWAVTYKDTQIEFGNTMVVYVDCSTGLVVGGDQSK